MPPDPSRWFVDRYLDHVIRSVNAKADRVRDLQATSGRAQSRVVRYEVYKGDVRRRDIPQTVYAFTVRVTPGGRMERLDDGMRPDVTVYSDVATVRG
ncbi:MAG: hypothetical protein ACRDWE_04175, partial [Acidimicrobiales bacterium]